MYLATVRPTQRQTSLRGTTPRRPAVCTNGTLGRFSRRVLRLHLVRWLQRRVAVRRALGNNFDGSGTVTGVNQFTYTADFGQDVTAAFSAEEASQASAVTKRR